MKIIKILTTFVVVFLFSFLIEAEELEIAWESEKVFELPESVIYDKTNDVLYVSNIVNHPFKKDGSGYISKMSLDGKVVEKKWIKSLNAPKGLTIFKDKLYIADVDELVEVDIASGKVINKYKGSGAVCFNDVTADKYGNVYVGDTYTDSIYRLNQFSQLPIWLNSPNLAPNGIHIDSDKSQMIVGSWGSVMEGWGTPERSGNLKVVDLNTKKVKNLGPDKTIGNLDGIEADGKGAYYVTDWSAGKLYSMKNNSKVKVLKSTEQGAADHEVILDKNLILIPIMTEGKVIALKIN